MNVLTYNGQTSESFGLIIAGSNSEVAAARSRDEIVVPGRNGSIFIDNGSYLNVKISFEVVLKDAAITNMMAISRWLLGPTDYVKLEESEKPEYYRMAIFDGSFEAVRTALNEKGKATLSVACAPQKYLNQNGQEVAIDLDVSGGVLSYTAVPNTGDFSYRPRFVIEMPAYSFQNDSGIQINWMQPDGTIGVCFQMRSEEDWSGKKIEIDFLSKKVLVDGAFPTGLMFFQFPTVDMVPGVHQFAISATTNYSTPVIPTRATAYPRSWVI